MNLFKNKKVLIFGLGLNDGGLGMTEYFLKQGAQVTITDGKTQEQLKPSLNKLEKYKDSITLHLGGHIEEDFLENDIIVRNPAIKPNNEYLKIAQNAGKQIEMEMSLFHRYAQCPVIGITGTRGKSTTTTLIYEFLKQKYNEKIFLGGNIGKSAIREIDDLDDSNIAVLELSSFQLDTMGENKISPHIAVVTNIYKDHQDWHPSMDHYIDSKKNIYKYQDKNDYLVINIDNDITKTFVKDSKSIVITYSLENKDADYFLDKNLKIFENGKELLSIDEAKLEGKHNRFNILAAVATSRIYETAKEDIEDVLSTFKGVHGRQELIRELNGVKFFNDTTATSVEAVQAMFETFGKKYKGKIIMIAGGVDKGLDYSFLEKEMREYLKHLVLLEGSASEKIDMQMKGFANVHKYYDDFNKAIIEAYDLAESGDMIILCPGASSFNMFANEFDRGNKYVNYVKSLE
jgi:UDP-N-acetylmuramoylalanine--D-glutamate ligase